MEKAISKDDDLKDLLSQFYDFQLYTPNLYDFINAILDIEQLLKNTPDSPYQTKYFQLLYANVIAVFEAFLSDTLISQVLKNEKFMKSLLGNEDIFNKKYTLSQVSDRSFCIEAIVKEKLNSIIWHNLKRAEGIYKSAFGTGFPKERIFLNEAILYRHHIVHRNGKDINGEEVIITHEDVTNLIRSTESFITSLNASLLEIVKEDGTST